MTKRVLTLALAVLFVLSCSMLAACSTTSENTTTPANSTTASAASTTPAATPSTTETPVASTTEAPTTTTPVAPTTETPTTTTPVVPTTETPTTTTPVDNDEPEINTAEWAAYVSENGSDNYADLEMLGSRFYTVTHPDAQEACPWEIWGDHFHFLIVFDTFDFAISFNDAEPSPFTWYIWYIDIDDEEAEWKCCETKPWSLYDYGTGEYIFRTPTYAGGMDDLHTDDGETNVYEFIIVIIDDETEEVVCWHDTYVNITDSYECYLEEALDNNVKLSWND